MSDQPVEPAYEAVITCKAFMCMMQYYVLSVMEPTYQAVILRMAHFHDAILCLMSHEAHISSCHSLYSICL